MLRALTGPVLKIVVDLLFSQPVSIPRHTVPEIPGMTSSSSGTLALGRVIQAASSGCLRSGSAASNLPSGLAQAVAMIKLRRCEAKRDLPTVHLGYTHTEPHGIRQTLSI